MLIQIDQKLDIRTGDREATAGSSSMGSQEAFAPAGSLQSVNDESRPAGRSEKLWVPKHVFEAFQFLEMRAMKRSRDHQLARGAFFVPTMTQFMRNVRSMVRRRCSIYVKQKEDAIKYKQACLQAQVAGEPEPAQKYAWHRTA